MSRKLIVSDIDGTLLRSDKTISEPTKTYILKLIAEGNPFAIATGRMHAAGKIVTQQLDYDGFLISCNGAVVKHLKTDELIQAIELKPELASQVAAICEKYDAYYHFYGIQDIYASKKAHLAQKYFDGMPNLPEAFQFNIEFIEDMPSTIGKVPIYKIGLYHEVPELFSKIMAEINEVEGLETCKSLETSFDVMAKGVTKATGIEAIRRYYEIDIKDVMAFGDNENDSDMITYAGIGVAMGNATPELKAIADYVTSSNDENGMVYAFEQLLEQEMVNKFLLF